MIEQLNAIGVWLYEWQQMVGTIVGFAGILIAFWLNTREQRKRARADRAILAGALITELRELVLELSWISKDDEPMLMADAGDTFPSQGMAHR